MTCSLCGFRFEKANVACGSCPLHSSCRVLCCPHCGYQFVEESTLWRLFRRLFAGRRGKEAA